MNIEKLKRELVSQKNSKFKGNIYHYSQINFAYILIRLRVHT